MALPKLKTFKPASCHPDREHYAFGLCGPCYQRGNRYRFKSASAATQRKRYAALPLEFKRHRRLMTQFGITVHRYNQMLREQNGKCAICKREGDGRWKTLNVDHDHSTKQVRDLLCLRCNRAVGLLADDLQIARQLVAYLERWQKQSRKNKGGRNH